jgi:hypothetical protein
MDHVAIMKKSWKMILKILSGEKRIESRWGINKCTPWGKVTKGDMVYFKYSGEAVTAKAKVSKILEFENLTPLKVREILNKYGGKNEIAIDDPKAIFAWAKSKHYCTLIYLTNPQSIRPFNIDKSGFGSLTAWISVKNINKVRESVLQL